MSDLKSRFNRVYCNLPMDERRMSIAVIDNQPMSWNVCHEEVNADTKLSSRILEWLNTMGLI
jgi:hypothetical protein